MTAPPGTQTVTVVHRVRDRMGDWAETGRVPVSGCSIQPGPSNETSEDGRQATRQKFWIYGPPDLGVAQGQDLVEIPGWITGGAEPAVALELDGTASTSPDEYGRPHHVEIIATLYTG